MYPVVPELPLSAILNLNPPATEGDPVSSI